MSQPIEWGVVTSVHVMQAIQEFQELGAERFFAKNGFAPATTTSPSSAPG